MSIGQEGGLLGLLPAATAGSGTATEVRGNWSEKCGDQDEVDGSVPEGYTEHCGQTLQDGQHYLQERDPGPAPALPYL